jgi:hypothetical protein
MKTSDAEKHDYVCPSCGSRLAHDRKKRGFVRHLTRMDDGKICPHGPTRERDRDEP